MSELYPDLPGSNFPINEDTIEKPQDVGLKDLPYMNRLLECITANDLAGANAIYEEYPELKKKTITAELIGQMIDAIKSIERFYLDDVQNWIRTLIIYKGEYDPTYQYDKNMVVSYINQGAIETYECLIKPPIGTPPTDNTYWVARTLRGEKGDPGLNLSPCGDWDRVTDYYTNDFVSHNNALYYAANDNNQSEPTQTEGISTNPDWICMMALNQAADTILMPYGKTILDVVNDVYFFDISCLANDELYYISETTTTSDGESEVTTEYIKYKSDDSVYATNQITYTLTDTIDTWVIITSIPSIGFNKTITWTYNETNNTWTTKV